MCIWRIFSGNQSIKLLWKEVAVVQCVILISVKAHEWFFNVQCLLLGNMLFISKKPGELSLGHFICVGWCSTLYISVWGGHALYIYMLFHWGHVIMTFAISFPCLYIFHASKTVELPIYTSGKTQCIYGSNISQGCWASHFFRGSSFDPGHNITAFTLSDFL